MVVKAIAGCLSVAALLSITACGDSKDPGAEAPSFTYAEAVKMVDDSLKAAAAALTPQPTLQVAAEGEAPCTGPNDDQHTDKIMHERVYWLRKIPSEQNANIVDQLRKHWRDNGYIINVEDLNTSPGGLWTVVASNEATGFEMRLVKATGGELSLGAQSTCVDDPRD